MRNKSHSTLSTALGTLALSLTLAACGGGDGGGNNNGQSGSGGAFQGIWTAAGYGQVLAIEGSRVRSYDYSTDFCLLSDEESGVSDADLRDENWTLSADGQSIRVSLTYLGLDYRGPEYRRQDSLPASCASPVAQQGQGGYSADALRDFDYFAQIFQEYYLSFDLKGVDWAANTASLRDGLTSASDQETLFLTLAEAIRPLRDAHVKVFIADQALASFNGHPTLNERFHQQWVDANGAVDSEAKQQQYVAYMEGQNQRVRAIRQHYALPGTLDQAANDKLSWYIAPDNIGVLMLDSFIGFSGDQANIEDYDEEAEYTALENALDQAMAALANTDALIFDLRLNGGGLDFAAGLVVRRFLDTERTLQYRQVREGSSFSEPEARVIAPAGNPYLKPVAVLTSADTASAAESLVMMLRELPHVVLMGGNTQGILSDVLIKQLPGGIDVWLSNERLTTPSGEWFEDSGIPVAIEVPFATARDLEAEEDSGLEAAHALLTQ
ncbi:MAG: hypothetical protein CME59_23015 [Halioglobus sp.]|nr:hypothetical protein [Halioglobus sp.]|tara:strand:+ start:1548 stop:3035 length:1488 start_codon:yes stop_codon:yes gene_type:complete